MAPTKAGNINPQLDVWPKFGPNLAAFFQLNTSHPFAGEGVGSRYLPRFLLWAQIDCSTHQIAFSHESQPLKAKIESILWSLWTLDSIHCFTFKTGRLLAHLNPMLVLTFRDTSDPHWFNFRKQPSSDLAVFCGKHLRPNWRPWCQAVWAHQTAADVEKISVKISLICPTPALEKGWGDVGWKLDLLFTLLTYFLKTLQAAALHFEMKSLKIRDLLHLCQSSLGIIERNNLPNASLVGNSRNLSPETLSRPVAALYWQKVRFVSKVNREHVIDWVKTQWRLFSQVNDM